MAFLCSMVIQMKQRMRWTLSFLSLIFLLAACSKTGTNIAELKTGIWRATLKIQNREVPFSIDVVRDSSGGYDFYIVNAQERLLLDEVEYAGDSVKIPLHIFDASIIANVSSDHLMGFFVKHYEKDYRIPFEAVYGVNERFMLKDEAPSKNNLSGKYRVLFYEKTDTVEAVGVFNHNDKKLTGTFLTPTGDYRYLEGTVSGDSLYLSTFDGNYVYLFQAKATSDSIAGRFYSGKTKSIQWVGVRDENASLPDPESLTFLKEGYETIEFTFPDVNGKATSLKDDKYKNKVVILQIFGTWCPNCMDETRFLAPWYDKNKQRGVEIIGLAYERKDDFNYASDRVKRMIDKFDVQYDFVIAGVNDKEKASATLPMLNRVVAFPTTIFIGKDGKVKKIETGFSGPGTGVYYDQFVEHFNETVNRLLSEGENTASTAKL
jgi:thiol-disulfide isomerase/thioredoxin